MTLEEIIQDLVTRYETAPDGSAEQRFTARQLAGLRLTREGAAGIIESVSPFYWFGDPSLLSARTASTKNGG